MGYRAGMALLITGGLLVIACAGPASPTSAPSPAATPAAASAPTATAAPPTAAPPTATRAPAVTPTESQPTPTAATPGGQAQASPSAAGIDWTQIFPAGRGQQLVLQNCGSCHDFNRIVTGQRTQAAWSAVKNDHRSKVPAMSQADYDELLNYLEANFNPSKPEPKLPQGAPGPSSPV